MCTASLSVITQWEIFNCTSTCSLQANIDRSVITTLSELLIPAQTLAYGLYKLKLTVKMIASPDLNSSAIVYVKINPSNITANLIKFGTSMIIWSQEQDLTLDPGTFSVNPDETTFNASSIMQPLASAGASKSQANTNLSRSISVSLLNQDDNEISLPTNVDHPIEFFIPRDPNLLMPPMILQNVTSMNGDQSFHLHFVNMTQFLINNNLTVSLHFEIRPLNTSLGYLFIYKFDSSPQLDSSINRIDGWSLLCPSSKFYCCDS
ncbi:unnamed protein product [Rotaria sp. Silwood1]|nr:unnamed protein product [Rotaria sp. Silwood1]